MPQTGGIWLDPEGLVRFDWEERIPEERDERANMGLWKGYGMLRRP